MKWKDNWGYTDGAFAVFFSIGLSVVAAGIAVPCCSISGCGGADGAHASYVIAVEDQNNITWDSTVVHVKTNPQASNEDCYCVNDPAVRKQLDEAAETGERVVLHYRNDLVMMRWECNGGSSIIWKVSRPSEKQ